MLNLSVNTTLNTGDALDRSYQYFVEEQGLQLVEWVAHLHAEQGACELRITGGKIKGTTEVDSKAVLLSQAERLIKDYGFKPVYYGLHLHTVPDEEVGHLMVAVKETDPVEITFETQELDFPVKEFSAQLPKA
ncbi:MAG: hypothetical protein KAR73_10270 [Spirochaetales bacterium]|jgi:hypothetical protein|nr:hypothetical protein [Spirochaetales bacterium]